MIRDTEVLVIGGGAAGLLAAIRAARMGVRVIVAEKNRQTGRKLRISGKGRCNITNTAEKQAFIRQYGPRGKFLHSAFARFFRQDILALLEQAGVRAKEERGGRVFPESDKAAEVADALEKLAMDAGAEIITNCRVESLISGADRVISGAITRGARDSAPGETRITARAVIIATGGMSYPLTGSTGDGYEWARALGHSVTDLRPGLVPLETPDTWVKELTGLTLKNVEATMWEAAGGSPAPKEGNEEARARSRRIASYQGEMLFTHFGLTGPIILSLSRHYSDRLPGPIYITIDLKPALSPEVLDKRLLRDFLKYKSKNLSNAMVDLLPKALIAPVIARSGLSPDTRVSELTKSARLEIGRALKALPVNISGTRPLDEAIVTAGGVSLTEIEPKTMESKIIRGLYFAGEILDIDGQTGGYNLQAAFSTGWTAGEAAARRALSKRDLT